MQFKQASFSQVSQSRAQGGFTLIELIVVIVILGILAATALPKFADMGADARHAKMQGARGAVSSAAAIARAQWLVTGTTTSRSVSLDGVAISVNDKGYPDAAGIASAAGLDTTTDYKITGTDTVTIADFKTNTCLFTYTPANGTVTAVTATSTC